MSFSIRAGEDELELAWESEDGEAGLPRSGCVRDSVTPTVSFLYIAVVPLRWLWALSSFVGEGSCVGSDCDFEFWCNCGQSDGVNRWEAGPPL